MCVIAERLRCLRWLAHAASYGHLFTTATHKHIMSTSPLAHHRHLNRTTVDSFAYESAVLRVCCYAILTHRQAVPYVHQT